MNLLKEITGTGKITPTYAKLTLQFTFYNPTEHPLSPRYFFPIPEGASITGMQLLTNKKTLLRAEIAPLAELGSADGGFQLTQLDPQLYALKWESLPPGDTCMVLVECLLHLCPQMGQCRLVLPFGIPFGQPQKASPCPVNLDFSLEDLEPLRLAMEDSFDPTTQTISCTAWAGEDFVRDFLVQAPKSRSLIQEEFGTGLGFARIGYPAEKLLHESAKTRVLLLLDLSHASTRRIGNALKELLFRIADALPKEMPTQILSTASSPLEYTDKNHLYQALQTLPVGVGSLEELFQTAIAHQDTDTLTILVSDGSYAPAQLSEFPLVLATMGNVRQTILSHSLSGEHLHFYPKDALEKELPHHIERLLHPIAPIEVVPEGSTVHDCFIFPHENTLADGYLDLAFSYTGQPPQGFALWQAGEKQLTSPLLNPKIHSRLPDAEQLFAIAKIRGLTELLKKATPVSGRSIKKELTTLQTKYRILGSETILTIPTKDTVRTGIPARFYSTTFDGLSALNDRPTIFGEGIRNLPKEKQTHLADLCRKAIYDSIRSNGSIHSPLGITPQMSAEETTLSLLALLADGKTDQSIIRDALFYLASAPRTPWSFLLDESPKKETLQRALLPKLPKLETLLASLDDSLPLTVAAYLLLWISLV
ncbi:MAG: hypothetical protein J6A56_02815 [Clostridia bacterium]|nr:hypothetical protein [Clostridia bacterium]